MRTQTSPCHSSGCHSAIVSYHTGPPTPRYGNFFFYAVYVDGALLVIVCNELSHY